MIVNGDRLSDAGLRGRRDTEGCHWARIVAQWVRAMTAMLASHINAGLSSSRSASDLGVSGWGLKN